jgi:hypothetical protein
MKKRDIESWELLSYLPSVTPDDFTWDFPDFLCSDGNIQRYLTIQTLIIVQSNCDTLEVRWRTMDAGQEEDVLVDISDTVWWSNEGERRLILQAAVEATEHVHHYVWTIGTF